MIENSIFLPIPQLEGEEFAVFDRCGIHHKHDGHDYWHPYERVHEGEEEHPPLKLPEFPRVRDILTDASHVWGHRTIPSLQSWLMGGARDKTVVRSGQDRYLVRCLPDGLHVIDQFGDARFVLITRTKGNIYRIPHTTPLGEDDPILSLGVLSYEDNTPHISIDGEGVQGLAFLHNILWQEMFELLLLERFGYLPLPERRDDGDDEEQEVEA